MRRALLLLAAALQVSCHREPPTASPRLQELRQTHARLHERLEQLAAKDPLLAEVAADQGEVAVGLRATLVRDLFKEVARRYLDRVDLDLNKDIRVQEGGEVKKKTFLGTLKAGDWALDLTVHRVHGVFRAKAPRVDFAGTNSVRLGLSVVLEGAQGSTTVHFAWAASGVASVVCHDFQFDHDLDAVVLPDEYPVAGSFMLSAGAEKLLARPSFPDKAFRLRVDLTPESWAEVRKALDRQDTLLKCGIALDPDMLVPRLKDLARNGFDLKLPRSLFRPIELPASLRQSVTVEDRRVDLTVRPNALRVTRDTLWYSAAFRSRVLASRPRAPSPTPSPPHSKARRPLTTGAGGVG